MHNELDALLARSVASGRARGLVGMIGKSDTVVWSGSAGLRDGDDPISPDTIFWLASCTKLVTSIAALQAVERGLLKLDAPIDDVLPDMADYAVLAEFDAEGAPVLRPPARRITLRHLLSHTSGLGYDFMDATLLRARGSGGPPLPWTLASIRGPLLFDPGEGWAYGTGIDWAGLMIEAVSGRSLADWFEAEIFGPLGMVDSRFAVPTSRRAKLHQRADDGQFTPIPSVVDDDSLWEFFAGGSGLFSTAHDYLRLLQALLGRDGGILGDEMVDLLFTPQTGVHRAGVLGSVIPAMNAPFDLLAGMPAAWSLGGLVNPLDVPGMRRAGSLGWAGIANTHYWIDPASGICAVLFAQHLPFADPSMMATLAEFERATYAGL